LELDMKSYLTIAFAAMAVLSSRQWAAAQGVGAGGGVVGSSGVIMSPLSQPSAPSVGTVTSPRTAPPSGVTTGAVGSRAATGLPGDNPSAPGFPGKVGQ
jgi:hypothetical protein